MQGQRAELIWRAGDVPVSTRFDDPYFSLEDGLAESRFVFLDGNDLPARFRDGFHIAELGFGIGLNFLATVAAAGAIAGTIHYTGFEAYSMDIAELERALGVFPELDPLAQELLTQWGQTEIRVENVHLSLILGDARTTLPLWQGRADAWYLDGFAPAKNPELWQSDLLQAVADHTTTSGTAATYSAAGAVRRALQAAGFEVERIPGYGRKRHMTRAIKP